MMITAFLISLFSLLISKLSTSFFISNNVNTNNIQRTRPYKLTTIMMSDNDDNNDQSNTKQNTMFERVIDDFIGKRYGAGEAFYGKRTSRLTEEEYAKTKGGQKRIYDKNAPMQDDAVLIVGNVKDIGQWIAFELNDKGFNIRIACTKLKDASDVLGYTTFLTQILRYYQHYTSYTYHICLLCI